MATASKVADIVHKTVATGLIVMTVAGFADVTRGFSVLVKRNVDRRNAAENGVPHADASAVQPTGSSSSEQ